MGSGILYWSFSPGSVCSYWWLCKWLYQVQFLYLIAVPKFSSPKPVAVSWSKPYPPLLFMNSGRLPIAFCTMTTSACVTSLWYLLSWLPCLSCSTPWDDSHPDTFVCLKTFLIFKNFKWIFKSWQVLIEENWRESIASRVASIVWKVHNFNKFLFILYFKHKTRKCIFHWCHMAIDNCEGIQALVVTHECQLAEALP